MVCRCNFKFCHAKFDPEVPRCAQIDFINTGYRCELNFKNAFKSVFSFHNETFNIWSHLLAGIGFVFCLLYTESLVYGICFLSMITTMMFSTLYHIFCSSTGIYYYALGCDNVGMFNTIIACVGTFIFFFGKTISLTWSLVYLISFLITGIVSCSIFIYPVLKQAKIKLDIQGDQLIRNNKLGHYCIVFTSFFWIIPCIHSYYVNKHICLGLIKYTLIELSGWAFTFFVWFVRYPERKFIGNFDYFGNSHNIFHILIVCMNIFHIYNTIKCFKLFS